eukprot:467574-Prymnesium_polylepis.1
MPARGAPHAREECSPYGMRGQSDEGERARGPNSLAARTHAAQRWPNRECDEDAAICASHRMVHGHGHGRMEGPALNAQWKAVALWPVRWLFKCNAISECEVIVVTQPYHLKINSKVVARLYRLRLYPRTEW